MAKAVRFDKYGGTDVLHVVDVPRPRPGEGEVLVEVVTAGINPGEIGIREGVFANIWPATFPEGQGNDFAGYVAELGDGVTTFAIGDEVIGFKPRAAQASFVVVPPNVLAPKPPGLDWEVAGAIAAVGPTAWAAVQAVNIARGETVVVSAAAGGVGVVASQLARRRGARVIGTASENNFDFLRSLGIIPVRHGAGLEARIRELTSRVDAYLDNFGRGNVDVAIALGVPPSRINTIADGGAVRRYGVRSDAHDEGFSPSVVSALAKLVVQRELQIPIMRTYPLEHVRDAYEELQKRHTRGKIVLEIMPPSARHRG